MLLTDFDYHLPDSHIAQTPAEPRDSAKLLCLERQSGQIDDRVFSDIADILTDNDVLVVNETRVINARLKGFIMQPSQTSLNPSLLRREKTAASSLLEERIERGKPCEIFLHKQVSDNSWDCLIYPGKKLKPGTEVIFVSPCSGKDKGETERSENFEVEAMQGGLRGELLRGKIVGTSDTGRIVEFSHGGAEFLDIIERIGEIPLPPYIKDTSSDSERYQTVYNDSDKSGSVAAPTAGLHFTPELMKRLKDKGVMIEKVCLHVGLGTFMNVEVENIQDHDMHCEQIYISPETSHRLNTYKSDGKRIIAVGTTSVRTLESMSDDNGHLGHGQRDTDIFIYPGYQWRFVDSIITNFHLPKSTLLMLVSSFAGDENRKRAYQHAVDSHYRFFSFGDAMWIY